MIFFAKLMLLIAMLAMTAGLSEIMKQPKPPKYWYMKADSTARAEIDKELRAKF